MQQITDELLKTVPHKGYCTNEINGVHAFYKSLDIKFEVGEFEFELMTVTILTDEKEVDNYFQQLVSCQLETFGLLIELNHLDTISSLKIVDGKTWFFTSINTIYKEEFGYYKIKLAGVGETKAKSKKHFNDAVSMQIRFLKTLQPNN